MLKPKIKIQAKKSLSENDNRTISYQLTRNSYLFLVSFFQKEAVFQRIGDNTYCILRNSAFLAALSGITCGILRKKDNVFGRISTIFRLFSIAPLIVPK